MKRNIIFAAVTALFLMIPPGLSAEDIRELYEKGMAYLQSGEVDRAIDFFESEIHGSPNPILYNALGACYLQKEGAFRKAVNAFNQALRMDPNSIEAYFNLGLGYAGPGKDFVKAEQNFRKTVELNPNFSRGYLSLGWLYMSEMHEITKSTKFFKKSVRLDPEDSSAWYGLGLSYAFQGKRERVLKPISRLRALNREDLAQNLEQILTEKDKQENPPPEEQEPPPGWNPPPSQ